MVVWIFGTRQSILFGTMPKCSRNIFEGQYSMPQVERIYFFEGTPCPKLFSRDSILLIPGIRKTLETRRALIDQKKEKRKQKTWKPRRCSKTRKEAERKRQKRSQMCCCEPWMKSDTMTMASYDSSRTGGTTRAGASARRLLPPAKPRVRSFRASGGTVSMSLIHITT